MENLQLLSGFISSLVPVISKIIHAQRKKKSMFYNLQVMQHIKNEAPEYYNSFILPKAKEDIFFEETGIRTHSSNIPKFIAFRDKLRYGNWERIAEAYNGNYLKTTGNEIQVIRRPVMHVLQYISDFSLLTFILTLLVFGITSIILAENITSEGFILSFFILVFVYFSIWFLLYQSKESRSAKLIRRRLKEEEE